MRLRISEMLQRCYVEVVRRRARLRIVPAAPSLPPAEGIFLLGLYRSGTTPLRYVLDSHTEVACPPESNFLLQLSALLEDERSLAGLEAMGFDYDHVVSELRRFCCYFYGNYAASRGAKHWADKTPSYVGILPFLQLLFPGAQYVVIHRHPLDQVYSHTRGGKTIHDPVKRFLVPGMDVRVAAALYWAFHTEKLLELQRNRAHHCTSLRYEDLCRTPAREIERVCGFLNLPWEPTMLDYRRASHDVGMEGGKALGKRGFELSHGHYRTWPRPIIEECLEVTAAQRAALGYRLGPDDPDLAADPKWFGSASL